MEDNNSYLNDLLEQGYIDDKGNLTNKSLSVGRAGISTIVKPIRESLYPSLYSMSQVTDMSINTLLKIEDGTGNYTIDNLQRYLSAIGCSLMILQNEQ